MSMKTAEGKSKTTQRSVVIWHCGISDKELCQSARLLTEVWQKATGNVVYNKLWQKIVLHEGPQKIMEISELFTKFDITTIEGIAMTALGCKYAFASQILMFFACRLCFVGVVALLGIVRFAAGHRVVMQKLLYKQVRVLSVSRDREIERSRDRE